MTKAHFFVIIDRWGKCRVCRLCTVPLNADNDGTKVCLHQGLGHITNFVSLPNVQGNAPQHSLIFSFQYARIFVVAVSSSLFPMCEGLHPNSAAPSKLTSSASMLYRSHNYSFQRKERLSSAHFFAHNSRMAFPLSPIENFMSLFPVYSTKTET